MNCVALDNNGNRCKNRGSITVSYHGDPEIYHYHFDNEEYDIRWVRIKICKTHFKENFESK